MDRRYVQINNMKGKYIKQVLTKLESVDKLTSEVRKCILDEMNDMFRELFTVLGYEDKKNG